MTQKSKTILTNILIFTCFCILFVFFLNPFDLLEKTYFFIFQERDIARARLLLEGKWIFFGPEMTGGSHLPGPLYYFFLSCALFFKSNWESAWWMQYFFAFLASLFVAIHFRKSSKVIMAFSIVFFATASFTSWFLQIFLNVSFLLPFVTASLTLICSAFDGDNIKKRNSSFLGACFVIGMGCQFHLSILSLLASIFFLQVFSKKIGVKSLSSKIFFSGLFFFLLPSAPYVIWLVCRNNGIHFGQEIFYSEDRSEPLGIGFLLIGNYLKAMAFEKFFYIGIFKKIIFTIPLTLLPLLMTAYGKFSLNKPTKIILICLLFSFPPYFNWYVSHQAVRYTMPFYICVLYLSIILIDETLLSKKRSEFFLKIAIPFQLVLWFFLGKINFELKNKLYIFSNIFLLGFCYLLINFIFFKKNNEKSVMIFSVLLILSINYSQRLMTPKISYSARSGEGFMANYSDWKKIGLAIQESTAWPYGKLKERIYFVGHHVHHAPGLFFKNFKKENVSQTSTINPDGFIVSNRFGVNGKKKEADFIKWLMQQYLHKDIFQALRENKLKLGKNLSSSSLVVPYWVLSQTKLPSHFHNFAEGYSYSTDDLNLEKIHGPEGILRLAPNEYLFKWNECPWQSPFCSTGAFLKIIKKSHDEVTIHLKIVGNTMSQISKWIGQNWTQAWINPYLKITCSKKTKTFLISSSIGYRRFYSYKKGVSSFFAGNNSILAPYEKDFTVKCNKKIERITLGRESSEVETIKEVKHLPGKSLNLEEIIF